MPIGVGTPRLSTVCDRGGSGRQWVAALAAILNAPMVPLAHGVLDAWIGDLAGAADERIFIALRDAVALHAHPLTIDHNADAIAASWFQPNRRSAFAALKKLRKPVRSPTMGTLGK
jgi:hypothetical protein